MLVVCAGSLIAFKVYKHFYRVQTSSAWSKTLKRNESSGSTSTELGFSEDQLKPKLTLYSTLEPSNASSRDIQRTFLISEFNDSPRNIQPTESPDGWRKCPAVSSITTTEQGYSQPPINQEFLATPTASVTHRTDATDVWGRRPSLLSETSQSESPTHPQSPASRVLLSPMMPGRSRSGSYPSAPPSTPNAGFTPAQMSLEQMPPAPPSTPIFKSGVGHKRGVLQESTRAGIKWGSLMKNDPCLDCGDEEGTPRNSQKVSRASSVDSQYMDDFEAPDNDEDPCTLNDGGSKERVAVMQESCIIGVTRTIRDELHRSQEMAKIAANIKESLPQIKESP